MAHSAHGSSDLVSSSPQRSVGIRARRGAMAARVVPGLGASAALLGALAAGGAHAAEAVAASTSVASADLPTLAVKGRRTESFKADQSASNKITQPLLDTPKSVQVISSEVIREQGAASLMEALRNTPGITMQLGENGSTSAGDTFMMRGFSTQTSTFVDGVRDLGAVTRDVFNVGQVEVVKGPAGADVGRGATSGYINLISKLPSTERSNEASVTLGSADRKRVTADLNTVVGETSAFRLNVMAQDSGVPGRDVVKNSGFGVAPSFVTGLNTPTRIYLFSQHIRQSNVPDGGVPTVGLQGYYSSTAALNAAGRVNSRNYYGSADDYERVNADMFTVKVEHNVSDGTVLRNLTRYGLTTMDRVLTSVGAVTASGSNPAQWTVARSRQRVDQLNEILVNQTSLNSVQQWGGLKHDVVAGLELMYERQRNNTAATAAATIDGVSYAATSIPAASLYSPNVNDTLGVPYLNGAYTDGHANTVSLYGMDTVSLGEAWKLSGGVRLDRFFAKTRAATVSGTTLVKDTQSDSDTLASWNAGVVYKPAANGSVYASVANSLTPPGGANFALSTTATNQANSAMKPQETFAAELGTKWDVLDKQLNLTAALYRTENKNQTSVDQVTGQTLQFGKTVVNGVEFGAVGQLTRYWQLSAGVQHMKASQEAQYSATASTTGVRWSPEWAGTVWSSWSKDAYTFGGGVRYMGEQKRLITAGSDPATTVMPSIPAYAVADLMASYRVNKNVSVQLNVYNLFDKDYISSVNNNGLRYIPGASRSAALTASFKF